METKIVSEITQVIGHFKNDLRIPVNVIKDLETANGREVTSDSSSHDELMSMGWGADDDYESVRQLQAQWAREEQEGQISSECYPDVGYEQPVDDNEEICDDDLGSSVSPVPEKVDVVNEQVILNADDVFVGEDDHVTKRKQSYSRIEKKFRTQKALAEMVLASKKLIVQQKKIRVRGKLDEAKTITTNDSQASLQQYGNAYELGKYIQNRSYEVAALYKNLGCEARENEVNMWGSRREVVAEARERQAEWTTTRVSAWLRSLLEPQKKWNGQELPYVALLPYLPPKVETYLDFGSGSGSGAAQVRRYLGSTAITHCYDVQNNVAERYKGIVQYVSSVTREYDLVTMVNVMHHVESLESVLAQAMSSVRTNGTLVIKDHFVNTESILIATLVHEMYEPTVMGVEPENLYFRDMVTIVDFIKAQGWIVKIEKLEGSDVSNYVLVCVNSRDGGLSRVAALEERMDLLADEVARLRETRSNDYSDPSEKLRRGGAVRRKNVIDKHDLALARPIKHEEVEHYPSGQQVKVMTVQDRQRRNKNVKAVSNPRDYNGPEVSKSTQDVGVGPRVVSKTRERKTQQAQYREKVVTPPSKPASKPVLQYVIAKPIVENNIVKQDNLDVEVGELKKMTLAQRRLLNASVKQDH
jgi:SAM-dependent methyltransferase